MRGIEYGNNEDMALCSKESSINHRATETRVALLLYDLFNSRVETRVCARARALDPCTTVISNAAPVWRPHRSSFRGEKVPGGRQWQDLNSFFNAFRTTLFPRPPFNQLPGARSGLQIVTRDIWSFTLCALCHVPVWLNQKVTSLLCVWIFRESRKLC